MATDRPLQEVKTWELLDRLDKLRILINNDLTNGFEEIVRELAYREEC